MQRCGGVRGPPYAMQPVCAFPLPHGWCLSPRAAPGLWAVPRRMAPGRERDTRGCSGHMPQGSRVHTTAHILSRGAGGGRQAAGGTLLAALGGQGGCSQNRCSHEQYSVCCCAACHDHMRTQVGTIRRILCRKDHRRSRIERRHNGHYNSPPPPPPSTRTMIYNRGSVLCIAIALQYECRVPR